MEFVQIYQLRCHAFPRLSLISLLKDSDAMHKRKKCLTTPGWFFFQDLKPENLLLAERPSGDLPPVIKLTDFGIARAIEGILLR